MSPFDRVFNEKGVLVDPAEIDIEEIGAEGKDELLRSMIDFDKEYKALLPNRTWDNVIELCERKMGSADYMSFFKENQLSHPGFITDKAEQVKVAKELIAICKARE